jgi:hypothetical protein
MGLPAVMRHWWTAVGKCPVSTRCFCASRFASVDSVAENQDADDCDDGVAGESGKCLLLGHQFQPDQAQHDQDGDDIDAKRI